MKLVVDIPEEIYNSACATNNIWNMRMAGFVCSAIANGTPLEKVLGDIKAEIRKMPNRNPSYSHTCDVVDREDVLDIIDSHINGKEKEWTQ